MIDIEGLQFSYGNKDGLFQDLKLFLNPGQIHGLLGLNGAGKSSLLHLIQGLMYPDNGKIKVNGFIPKKRQVAFLQDSFLLAEEVYIPDISLKLFIDLYAPFYPNFSLESFLRFLKEFDLNGVIHMSNLSLGQRKKAMIAFALAANTKILLMDEPTNGLDIPSKKQFRKILSHIISTDRLFLISTHQIRDLHSLVDNVIVLEEGQIIFNYSIDKICDSLNFSLTPQPTNNFQTIYSERVPGGYLNIQPLVNGPSFEPDLEVLFNAILTYNNDITKAMNSNTADVT